jgi:hypothetical protein
MRTVDFSKYEFRCSSLGKLTVGLKPALTANQAKQIIDLRAKVDAGKITDKQLITLGELIDKRDAVPTLSATTQTYLKEIHAQEVFGKRKDIQSKFLDKGNMVEEQAITLYSEVTGQLFLKNRERKNNGLIVGTCDNAQGKIRDIKSSWDLGTFPLHEDTLPNKDYWWQVQGYMELWDLDSAEVIYCLVDTPDILIEDEKRKMLYRIGEFDLPPELEAEIMNTMTFSDIPKELRCRVYPVERDREAMAMLKDQIVRCREYLNGLSESLSNRLPVQN